MGLYHACAVEPGLGLTAVPSPSHDNLIVGNALDHNQAHESHRHGILSALYNVYGSWSVGESEHVALLGWETASAGRALRPNIVMP